MVKYHKILQFYNFTIQNTISDSEVCVNLNEATTVPYSLEINGQKKRPLTWNLTLAVGGDAAVTLLIPTLKLVDMVPEVQNYLSLILKTLKRLRQPL